MREKKFLDHKISFALELILGFLQSFINPLGVCWILLVLKRVESQDSLKTQFKIVWWSSFLYYTANLHWICFSLTIEIEKFWWLIPFGLFAMPAYVSLFCASSTLWLGRRTASGFPYLFPLSWISFEWIRGNFFVAFPWAFAGHAWLDTNLIQLAAWCGIFPLSLLVFYAYSLIPRKNAWVLPSLGIMGMLTLMYYPLSVENSFFEGKVRLVQPNIDQSYKWAAYRGEERFQLLLTLSETTDPDIRAVVFPETALTFFLDNFSDRLERIKAVIPKDGYLLTGAPRKEWINWAQHDYQMRTSLMAINKEGILVDYYDKTHLLPFGEYLPQPIRYFFPRLSKITHGDKDYSPGIGPKKMTLSGLPTFNPIICCESAFSAEIATSQRAEFILLITNDAWFGESVGPKQHLDLARVRAIEQGMSVIRVANTGISGVIDPKGHLLQHLPLGKRGVLDVAIPKPLNPTLYSTYLYLENYIMAILCLLLLLELGVRLRTRSSALK